VSPELFYFPELFLMAQMDTIRKNFEAMAQRVAEKQKALAAAYFSSKCS
jgi:hypothetical protein